MKWTEDFNNFNVALSTLRGYYDDTAFAEIISLKDDDELQEYRRRIEHDAEFYYERFYADDPTEFVESVLETFDEIAKQLRTER